MKVYPINKRITVKPEAATVLYVPTNQLYYTSSNKFSLLQIFFDFWIDSKILERGIVQPVVANSYWCSGLRIKLISRSYDH